MDLKLENKVALVTGGNSGGEAADEQGQVRLLVLLKQEPNVSDEDFAPVSREVHVKMVSELSGLLKYTQLSRAVR